MTAAFMWPGAEEPIGEWREGGLTIYAEYCRRQGIDEFDVDRELSARMVFVGQGFDESGSFWVYLPGRHRTVAAQHPAMSTAPPKR